MSYQECMTEIEHKPGHHIYVDLDAAFGNGRERTQRKIWTRLRETIFRSRNRRPNFEDWNDDCRNWKSRTDGRGGVQQARMMREGNPADGRISRTFSNINARFRKLRNRTNRPNSCITQETCTRNFRVTNGNVDPKVLAWFDTFMPKDRFNEAGRRCLDEASPEALFELGVARGDKDLRVMPGLHAMNTNRTQDTGMMERKDEFHGEYDLVQIDDADAFDCLFLKAPSKYDESWIPRMIYKVINCSWYWGDIDWFGASMALQKKPDGYFLIRKSSKPNYLFSISFKQCHKIIHVRIENRLNVEDNLNPSFPDLLGLIEHFQGTTREKFDSLPKLLYPLHKTNPSSLKELARGAVYKWCYTYSKAMFKIDSLYIPEDLRLYLKEFKYTQSMFSM